MRAGKAHIELREPSVGVSTTGMFHGESRINVKLGVDPFEIQGHVFHGVQLLVDVDWLDGAISQLKRAKELHRVEKNRIAKGLGK